MYLVGYGYAIDLKLNSFIWLNNTMERLEKYISIMAAILITAWTIFVVFIMLYCITALIYMGFVIS